MPFKKSVHSEPAYAKNNIARRVFYCDSTHSEVDGMQMAWPGFRFSTSSGLAIATIISLPGVNI